MILPEVLTPACAGRSSTIPLQYQNNKIPGIPPGILLKYGYSSFIAVVKVGKTYWQIVLSFTFCFFAYLAIPDGIEGIHWEPYNVHVHHFSYGIILLAVLCPLSLICSSPRARYWICLFYGLALFLVADEFIFWITLNADIDTGLLRQMGNIFVFSLFFLIFIIKKIKRTGK